MPVWPNKRLIGVNGEGIGFESRHARPPACDWVCTGAQLFGEEMVVVMYGTPLGDLGGGHMDICTLITRPPVAHLQALPPHLLFLLGTSRDVLGVPRGRRRRSYRSILPQEAHVRATPAPPSVGEGQGTPSQGTVVVFLVRLSRCQEHRIKKSSPKLHAG